MRQLHFGDRTFQVLLGFLAAFCAASAASAQKNKPFTFGAYTKLKVVGLYGSKRSAYSAAFREAKKYKQSVEDVTVEGRINGIRGTFHFSSSGQLAAALLTGTFNYKDEDAARRDVRNVARKLGCSPAVILIRAKIRGKLRLYGVVVQLVVSNNTRYPALVKIWVTKDKEEVAAIPPNEYRTLSFLRDQPLIKIRQGPPESYVYWVGKLPTEVPEGGHVALTLKPGKFPEKARITKELFGDETVSEGTGSGDQARKPKPAQPISWSSKEPERPGEVTVVLRKGACFTGKLVFENDKTIKIKTPTAELEWDKKWVKEVIHPRVDPPAEPKPGVPEKKRRPCEARILSIKKKPGKAGITLDLAWRAGGESIPGKKVTIAFLFQPKGKVQLTPEILAVKREYESGPVAQGMYRMLAQLEDGEGAILLFFTGASSSLNLNLSGQKTFTIPIQTGREWKGAARITGKGVLSVAVFKENDPALAQRPIPQLFMSTKYEQLSDVAELQIDLGTGK
ncbi:MAG: hypothetical protein GXP25_06600 [Planctomycetes bacterium]|nr:hypothetical protein [Planctomycetota bacterium]